MSFKDKMLYPLLALFLGRAPTRLISATVKIDISNRYFREAFRISSLLYPCLGTKPVASYCTPVAGSVCRSQAQALPYQTLGQDDRLLPGVN